MNDGSWFCQANKKSVDHRAKEAENSRNAQALLISWPRRTLSGFGLAWCVDHDATLSMVGIGCAFGASHQP